MADTVVPVSLGAVIASGVAFDMRSWRTNGVDSEQLRGAAAGLVKLLNERGLRYALAGGLAVHEYVGGRNTIDIDLVFDPASLPRLPELRLVERDRDFARADFDGLQVDLLLTSNRLFAAVLDRFVERRRFVEGDVQCVTPAGLAILKLSALPSLYRQGDRRRIALYEGDAEALLPLVGDDLDEVFAVLGQEMLASDVAELRKLLDEIRPKLDRFGPPRDEGAET